MVFAYPYFAMNRHNRGWTRVNYRRIMLAVSITHIFIAALGFILAPWIIETIFGNQYSDAVLPFRILLVSFVVQSTIRMIPGNLLVTQRKLRFNLYVSVFATAITLISNIILVREYASVGAAYAQLITMFLTGLINVYYYGRIIRRI